MQGDIAAIANGGDRESVIYQDRELDLLRDRLPVFVLIELDQEMAVSDDIFVRVASALHRVDSYENAFPGLVDWWLTLGYPALLSENIAGRNFQFAGFTVTLADGDAFAVSETGFEKDLEPVRNRLWQRFRLRRCCR